MNQSKPVDPAQIADGLAKVAKVLGVVVRRIEPDAIPLPEVTDLFARLVEIERLAAGARILLARRVEETRQWARDGDAKPEDWFARQTGSSTGKARSDLGTSNRLKDLDDTADALRDGLLSPEQAEAITDAATVNPEAERDLIDLSGRESVKNLKDECGRRKAQGDPDPDATRRRIHRNRRCRSWTDSEGAWNLAARGTIDQGVRFLAEWNRLTEQRFEHARKTGSHESREAYAFDALIDLAQLAGHTSAAGQQGAPAPPNTGTAPGTATGSPPTAPASTENTTLFPTDENDTERANDSERPRAKRVNPKHLALIRVDLTALQRGSVEAGELCEITGLGPLPVTTIRDLLGDSILKLVITRGVDVANITHLGRGVSAAQQIALLWSDPMCRVEGCHRTRLENDHRKDWRHTHHTRLDETDPECGHHHDLKTYKGWALVPGTGRRPMVPPTDPRHPNNQPATRQNERERENELA